MLEKTEQQTDEALVIASLRTPDSFGLLVERYEVKLNRYLVRLGIMNREDREDLLQEIFIKVYRNLNGFDTDLSFSSWIYRIAHNETVSWFRKRSVRPEGYLVGESDEVLRFIKDRQDSSELVFDQGLNAEVVRAALKEIDEKYRQVIILRYFENKEYEEISDILEIPVGSVGTWLYRGKKQLQRVLDTNKIRI
jgi:RNA polymerase sigma-70 factor, ECF subfamily